MLIRSCRELGELGVKAKVKVKVGAWLDVQLWGFASTATSAEQRTFLLLVFLRTFFKPAPPPPLQPTNRTISGWRQQNPPQQ